MTKARAMYFAVLPALVLTGIVVAIGFTTQWLADHAETLGWRVKNAGWDMNQTVRRWADRRLGRSV
jgi:hypothetical protein